MNAKPTKKVSHSDQDKLREEYRRDELGVGIRGKYFKQHSQRTNLVLLQPDIAEVCSTPAAVNDALRGLMQVAQRVARP